MSRQEKVCSTVSPQRGVPSTSDSITPGRLLVDRFRCPADIADLEVAGILSAEPGYFQFGSDAVCYGRCSTQTPSKSVTDVLYDVRDDVDIDASSVCLPFDFGEVLDNLRCERYQATWTGLKTLPSHSIARRLYQVARPLLATSARKQLQRLYFRGWDKIPFPRWPVERTIEELFEQLLVLSMKARKIDRLPFIWFWPNGAPSCVMITHDVETAAGWQSCSQLMDLNDSFGVKTSFQVVPEDRYAVLATHLDSMRSRGFEVNIHDLNHDGCLTCNREEFYRRARRINHYGFEFGARGFRSAVMYRNTDWYDALDFSYDMSIPNMGHLEAQQGGCCTVMPFFVGKILELPLTTTQDYSLFHILHDHSTRLWKDQMRLIREKNGLISFIIHPDYLTNHAARGAYTELLQYISEWRSQDETWVALPSEVDTWWRLRSSLNLVKEDGALRIEGSDKGRARIAWAVLTDDRLVYELA